MKKCRSLLDSDSNRKVLASLLSIVIGLAVGALVDILWLAFLSGTGIYEIIPGFFVGLVAAVVSMTASMLLLNLLITPYYMNCTMDYVAGLIPTLLFPFNLVKAIMNAGLSYVLYRPLRSALQAAGLLPRSAKAEGSGKVSVLALVVALLVIAAAGVCFIFVLGGKFTWIEA